MSVAYQNPKQRLVQAVIQFLKRLLGPNRALGVMKTLVRLLPYSLAFAVTWVCLDAFPVQAVSQDFWLCGHPRPFPQRAVKLNPHCLSGRFFAISGFFEQELTGLILDPKYQGTLVDIGANYGYYPVLWLEKSAQNRVIAVEPVTEYVALLQENLAPYGERYQIIQGCIGDYDGVALLDTLGDPTMLSKVVESDPTGHARSVSMFTLATLLDQQHIDQVDVLKIDAEGYDLRILQTARPLFEQKRIHRVFWETARLEAEQPWEQFLVDLGYRKILADYVTGYTLL